MRKFLLILNLIVLGCSEYTNNDNKDCIPRNYGHDSVVCVCNATYCDNFLHFEQLPKGQYLAYTSSQSGFRFKKEQGLFEPFSNDVDSIIINLDSSKSYQSIFGWGGAITDAVGININSLSSSAANYLLKSYFGREGLEYNFVRVPIGGSDFSSHGYSYDDTQEADPELKHFKIAPEDYEYKIPIIKTVQNLSGNNLDFIASAWTAPKWMKHNGKYTGPDVLRKGMYQTWTNYFLKFLQEYKKEGINFWGITTGNEPSSGLVPSKINSVGWLPSQMGTFIADHLGPTLRNSEFSSIKLITIDDQAFFFPGYIDLMFLNKNVSQYVDGFGLHWYWRGLVPSSVLTKTHNKYPDKFILATEASEGVGQSGRHVLLGDWSRAESYASDIINDLNNWVTGWIDWNIALNTIGGPTYIVNYLDSPIIVNATADEFYKEPMYYALGHFSKFIPKGSVRIETKTSSADINVVAFERPDNGTAITIMNKKTYEVQISIREQSEDEIKRTLPPRSITTIMWW